MSIKITKEILSLEQFSVNALCFIPQEIKHNHWSIFSHGYTVDKGSILNWASRLAEFGLPVMIHDQPGHYLGSFNEINSFEDFTENIHLLYLASFNCLKDKLQTDPDYLILGGHSLGGLTGIKALEIPEFKNIKKLAIGVGFGLNSDQKTHLFETDFYKKTLEIRNQLVSPQIPMEKVFTWIKDQKTKLSVKNQRIHLICGEDDFVVGNSGAETLKAILEKNLNQVTLFKPKKLPHHTPESAAVHIMSFLKSEFDWKYF